MNLQLTLLFFAMKILLFLHGGIAASEGFFQGSKSTISLEMLSTIALQLPRDYSLTCCNAMVQFGRSLCP